jgi:hypothetical protein
MLLVLHAIEPTKFWVVPWDELPEPKPKHIYIRDTRKDVGPMHFRTKNNLKRWKQREETTQSLPRALAQYYSIASTGSSPVRLFQDEEANTPIGQTAQKEIEYQRKRGSLLPQLVFGPPEESYLAHDSVVVVASKRYRVQEKLAVVRTDKSGYGSSVFMQRRQIKGPANPYKVGDFDALWVSVPPGDRGFYFIPSAVLITRGILQTSTVPGKKSLKIYPPGTPPSKNKRDLWANEFYFEYKDPDVLSKIEAVFAKYEPEAVQ